MTFLSAFLGAFLGAFAAFTAIAFGNHWWVKRQRRKHMDSITKEFEAAFSGFDRLARDLNDRRR